MLTICRKMPRPAQSREHPIFLEATNSNLSVPKRLQRNSRKKHLKNSGIAGKLFASLTFKKPLFCINFHHQCEPKSYVKRFKMHPPYLMPNLNNEPHLRGDNNDNNCLFYSPQIVEKTVLEYNLRHLNC